ncbi:MAG: YceI family protein [Janthinobacterium lividum]
MPRTLLLAVLLSVASPALALAQSPAPPALAAEALAVRPGEYVLDPDHARVTWSVNHLGYSVYSGLLLGAEGHLSLDPHDPARSTVAVHLRTGSGGTFDPALDRQLRGSGFLDAMRFPEAQFRSVRIVVTGPREARIEGDLTLRGFTKPLVLMATFNRAATDPVDGHYRIGFDASARMARTDWGVDAFVPFVGVDVTLAIEAEFVAQR